MLRLCAMFGVALALGVAVGPSAGQDKKDDKEVVGKIKEVSVTKKMFVVSLEDKSERIFQVNKQTKFTGPRGSDREDGLQDPCMSEGYQVRVVPAADESVAKEVKLAPWNPEDAKKKKGKKGG